MKRASRFRVLLRRHRIAAFTLLEMIVATALCGVLLAGLWTLYSTYANLFDRGQARVERSQLCRALMQQIADDLQAAIQDPIPGMPERAWGDAQRRRFGLAGTSSELRMDVLQITPRQGSRIPVGAAVGQSTDPPSARVPELRTIYYTFSSAVESSDSETIAAPAGLLRRELDFETPASDWDARSADSDLASSAGVDAEFGPSDQRPSQRAQDANASTAVDDRWTWVPEVVSVQFRYFDGTGWSSSWNSLQRNSLPVAVEVRIGLADPQSSAPAAAAAPAAPEAFEDEVVESPAVAAAVTHVQMIVDLPWSAEYRKPRVVDTSARQPAVRIPTARIAPRRWSSPKSSPQRLEDWLRTSTP
jgi:type II secretory pathway pseudopilin PulG